MENLPTESLQLLTLPQAAGLLAVCTRTLDRLISRKEFPPPLKIGRSSRVSLADVNAYLNRLNERRNQLGGTP